MLALIRILLICIFLVVVGTAGILFCLLRPFNPSNVQFFAILFGKVCWILGVKLDTRSAFKDNIEPPALIIGNHQNSYDIFTISSALPKRCVTIGKKSLKWIPFFGQLYWLSGNILINRDNRKAAHNTLKNTAKRMVDEKISVWIFPEGTRSYGKGLLKFKRGAFELAAAANLPVVPFVMSTTTGKIKLNRWNNGTVIIEKMAPIDMTDEQKNNSRVAANDFHKLIEHKLAQLDAEADEINKNLK